jgi:pimeloyl-ACP methyl ester carboxylesterase
VIEVPFYVPIGEEKIIFAIADLPEKDLKEPAVILTGAGRAGRPRTTVFKKTARKVAEAGKPVLRFDLPGCGLSPGDKVSSTEQNHVIHEAADWFLKEAGLSEMAIVGTCLGARAALDVAALDPRITRVAALACPTRPLEGDAGEEWTDPQNEPEKFISIVSSLIERCRLLFVYGDRDKWYRDFMTISSDMMPAEAADDIEVNVLEDGRLHGHQNVETNDQATDLLTQWLSNE